MTAKPPPVLKTRNLLLRPWIEEDAANLGKHLNTDVVMEHLGGRQTYAEQRKLMRWLIDDQQEWHGITYWCMERREDEEFMGFCGLVRVDDPESTVLDAVEVGFRIRSDVWGKGYANEAAIASLYYAFDTVRAQRVVSRTSLENQRSWGLMKRLGMEHDPRLDYVTADGGTMIVHAMTWPRWKQVRKKMPNTAVG